MGDGIAQLAALIDGSRRLRRTVAGHAAREGKLLEHFLHAFLVLADVWINLAVSAFHISIGNHEVSAMAGAGKINHVKIIALNHTVAVDIDKVLPWHCPPVAHDFLLYMIHG